MLAGLAFDPDAEDAATALLQRRWFAAFKAASGARAECEALLDSMACAHRAWKLARARLAELETLRDALAEEISQREDPPRNLEWPRDSDAYSAA